jgi:outer membrane protein assembly factor BamB
VAVAVFLAAWSASAAELPAHQSANAQVAAPLTFPLQSTWSTSLADSPSFPPAYDAGFGYFSLRNNQLVAIAMADGKTAWTVECPTTSAPTVGGGLVFTGGIEGIESRSQTSGQLVWTRPLEGRITSLYWDTGWLLAETDKGPLSAARAVDGELLWERDLGAPLHSPPALAGDRLYVSLEDGRIVALSLQTGEVLWTQQLEKPSDGILALAERLYIGSLDDWFYCLDTKDGKRRWRWRNDADVVGFPVIDQRRVYFVALDNLLRSLSRNSGSLVWKRALPMRPSSGPLLAGNLLVVPGLAAELHAYSIADGATAGDFALHGSQGEELQLAAPPHLTSYNSIIIVTKNGLLHSLASTPPAPTEPAAPAVVPGTAPTPENAPAPAAPAPPAPTVTP